MFSQGFENVSGVTGMVLIESLPSNGFRNLTGIFRELSSRMPRDTAVQGALCALPPVATVVHGMFNPHPQSRMRFLHWVLCQLVTSGAPMLNVQIPAGLAR